MLNVRECVDNFALNENEKKQLTYRVYDITNSSCDYKIINSSYSMLHCDQQINPIAANCRSTAFQFVAMDEVLITMGFYDQPLPSNACSITYLNHHQPDY